MSARRIADYSHLDPDDPYLSDKLNARLTRDGLTIVLPDQEIRLPGQLGVHLASAIGVYLHAAALAWLKAPPPSEAGPQGPPASAS